MNYLNIVSTGFPATNKTWRFLQSSLADPIRAIALAFGSPVILSGMETIKTQPPQVAAGLLIYDGEILPFQLCEKQDTVTIIETVENEDYNIDVNNDELFDNLPAYVTRYATCGVGGTATFNLADLKRVGDFTKIPFLEQFESKESIPYLICAGEFSYFGERLSMRGENRVGVPAVGDPILVPFSVELQSPGVYRITHNFGSTEYGVCGGGIATPSQFLAIKDRQTNYVDVEVYGEGGAVQAFPSYHFLIYKLGA